MLRNIFRWHIASNCRAVSANVESPNSAVGVTTALKRFNLPLIDRCLFTSMNLSFWKFPCPNANSFAASLMSLPLHGTPPHGNANVDGPLPDLRADLTACQSPARAVRCPRAAPERRTPQRAGPNPSRAVVKGRIITTTKTAQAAVPACVQQAGAIANPR